MPLSPLFSFFAHPVLYFRRSRPFLALTVPGPDQNPDVSTASFVPIFPFKASLL
jgi:hypothetical protein